MAMVRWDPFRELEEVSDRLNRFFGRSALSAPAGESGRDAMTSVDWIPSVDVTENAEEYAIQAELPGVPKENMKVSVENGVLKLSGERKQEKEEKGKRYHRIERQYGSFMRSFALPSDADDKNIHAEVKDGVLQLRMPKVRKEESKTVDVKVK